MFGKHRTTELVKALQQTGHVGRPVFGVEATRRGRQQRSLCEKCGLVCTRVCAHVGVMCALRGCVGVGVRIWVVCVRMWVGGCGCGCTCVCVCAHVRACAAARVRMSGGWECRCDVGKSMHRKLKCTCLLFKRSTVHPELFGRKSYNFWNAC